MPYRIAVEDTVKFNFPEKFYSVCKRRSVPIEISSSWETFEDAQETVRVLRDIMPEKCIHAIPTYNTKRG